MRELKFRAWVNNHWVDWLPTIETHGTYNDVAIDPDDYISDEKCYIEQYTGLKDKNGKEIYEGDIVIWLNGLNEYIEFKVEWQDNRARFCLRNEDSVFDYEDLNDKKEPYLEVIGNIHEPPKDFRPEHLKRMGVSISKGGEE